MLRTVACAALLVALYVQEGPEAMGMAAAWGVVAVALSAARRRPSA